MFYVFGLPIEASRSQVQSTSQSHRQHRGLRSSIPSIRTTASHTRRTSKSASKTSAACSTETARISLRGQGCKIAGRALGVHGAGKAEEGYHRRKATRTARNLQAQRSRTEVVAGKIRLCVPSALAGITWVFTFSINLYMSMPPCHSGSRRPHPRSVSCAPGLPSQLPQPDLP